MRPVGKQGLQAAAQGLGCMSLSKGAYGGEADIGPEEDRIAVIHSALSKGVTMLSTADLYGPYDNHELIGECTHTSACTPNCPFSKQFAIIPCQSVSTFSKSRSNDRVSSAGLLSLCEND